MFLTVAEIRELTGRARPKAQVAALKRMRIKHKVNELGRPIVTWGWVEQWYDGKDVPQTEPNFEALRA